MARKPLDINGSSRGELLFNIEQVVTRRKYSLLLQEATRVELHWAAPKRVHLKEGIRGLAVGVLWVKRVDKATRLTVQNVIDDWPLAFRPEPHCGVEPLWALRPRWCHGAQFDRPSCPPGFCFGRWNGQLQGCRAQAKDGNDENWGNDQA